MKKIFLAFVALLMAAGIGYAMNDGSYATGDTVSLGATTVKPSKSVYLGYKPDNTTAGSAQGYVLGAYHGSGTMTYASSSGDTKIYKANATAQTLGAAPTGSATATWASGWTAQ